jgi:hypothetical protein
MSSEDGMTGDGVKAAPVRRARWGGGWARCSAKPGARNR